MTRERIRILRVVARMNVGGVAVHVGLIGDRLDPERFETLLVHGTLGAGEASMEHLASGRVIVLPELKPEIDPRADAKALRALVKIIRDFDPHIVDTHTAKAGALGRAAARLSGVHRPAVVHTYHGHVLEGYFGRGGNAVYRNLERGGALVSDVLIGVSSATVDDLVRLKIAPRSRFRVMHYGLDLDAFTNVEPERTAAYRRASGVRDGELLLGFAGRLVPIKRVDVILRAFAEVRTAGVPARLAIAGDGELRSELEAQAASLGVSEAVVFHGFTDDVPAASAAADIAVLASDNEGTPLALIESGAAGVPAAATDAGGVPDVVAPGCGLLVPREDHSALARAIVRLASDPAERAAMGARAREHVLERYAANRMLENMADLYTELANGRVQERGQSPFLQPHEAQREEVNAR